MQNIAEFTVSKRYLSRKDASARKSYRQNETRQSHADASHPGPTIKERSKLDHDGRTIIQREAGK